MANVVRGQRNDGLYRAEVLSATVIEAGDLLFRAAAGDLQPFSSLADNGSEERNQAEAATLYAGVAQEASPTGSTRQIMVDAELHREYKFPAPSDTYAYGDLLGASEAASGTALEDQQLEKVTDPDLALFTVVRRETVATTTVKAKMIKSVLHPANKGPRLISNTETLAADKVLTHDDAKLQYLDPAGARNLDLPAEEESDGLEFVLVNRADAAEDISVRNDAAGAIGTISQNETGIARCDGTTWTLQVGANT